jgi:hypothetical protein
MAFNRPNTAAATTQANDSWKARGFLNFYLPTQSGKDRKIGAISLKLSSEDETKLAEWLEADEGNSAKLMARIKLVYRSAEKQEGSGFSLD